MMNNLLENSIIEDEEIKADILEILKEASGISMKAMAENALKGPSMATKRSIDSVKREETKDNDRGNVEYE